MAKVLGIGGVFFKAKDPDGLRDWYRRVLGITVTDWGGVMFEPLPTGVTVWTPFAADTEHFLPSAHDTMFNYVVDDLDRSAATTAASMAALPGCSIPMAARSSCGSPPPRISEGSLTPSRLHGRSPAGRITAKDSKFARAPAWSVAPWVCAAGPITLFARDFFSPWRA
jgi:hypothetical protein